MAAWPWMTAARLWHFPQVGRHEAPASLTIQPRRARVGLWNANATAETMPEEHAANGLLGRLTAAERQTLALFLARAFEGGVFETLKSLEAFEIPPFEDGYEGGPCHDFIGRLNEWEWPEQ